MTGSSANSSLNILVVDDEVNIRKTLSVCLETEGHKVIAVSNFQDAWRRLHEGLLNLLLWIFALAWRMAST